MSHGMPRWIRRDPKADAEAALRLKAILSLPRTLQADAGALPNDREQTDSTIAAPAGVSRVRGTGGEQYFAR